MITDVSRMRFKPTLRPLLHLDPDLVGNDDRLHSAAHVYLAESFVTAALNYRNIACVVEDQGASTADDYTMTPSVSQSDVAKCNVRLLIL